MVFSDFVRDCNILDSLRSRLRRKEELVKLNFLYTAGLHTNVPQSPQSVLVIHPFFGWGG